MGGTNSSVRNELNPHRREFNKMKYQKSARWTSMATFDSCHLVSLQLQCIVAIIIYSEIFFYLPLAQTSHMIPQQQNSTIGAGTDPVCWSNTHQSLTHFLTPATELRSSPSAMDVIPTRCSSLKSHLRSSAHGNVRSVYPLMWTAYLQVSLACRNPPYVVSGILNRIAVTFSWKDCHNMDCM